jgi:hypothetical protein
MRDPSIRHGYHALYQGPTLVGPQAGEKELGFSPCGSIKSAVTVNAVPLSHLSKKTGIVQSQRRQVRTIPREERFSI